MICKFEKKVRMVKVGIKVEIANEGGEFFYEKVVWDG